MFEIKIPEYVRISLELLKNANFEAYIVGGCVRDSLMGRVAHDYDITTSAKPMQIKEVFNSYRTIDTGIKHGTVTVIIDGMKLEITTFRVDGKYKDNRHPESVEFTTNLLEDLKRRDFTINAICWSGNNIIDYFDGIDDLTDKIIQCVGDPDFRFNEDGLRILRALRFASTLGFSIEDKTAISIHKNKALLNNISKERVFSELCKLICGVNAENILREFSDVFCVILPEITECIGFDQKTKYHCYDIYEHIIHTVSAVKPTRNLRLSALLHDIGKPKVFFTEENGVGHFYGHAKVSYEMTLNILNRFKSDKNTIKEVSELVLLHDREIVPELRLVKRFLSRYSVEFLYELLELKKADAAAHSEPYRDRSEYLAKIMDLVLIIQRENMCVKISSLDINGNDLIELGYKGTEIGNMLDSVLEMVMDEKIENKREIVLNYIKKKENK